MASVVDPLGLDAISSRSSEFKFWLTTQSISWCYWWAKLDARCQHEVRDYFIKSVNAQRPVLQKGFGVSKVASGWTLSFMVTKVDYLLLIYYFLVINRHTIYIIYDAEHLTSACFVVKKNHLLTNCRPPTDTANQTNSFCWKMVSPFSAQWLEGLWEASLTLPFSDEEFRFW